MVNVDLKYYTDSFGGDELDEKKFKNALKWATAQVNQITFGRIGRFDEVPECVKDAICAAIQKYVDYQQKAESKISSESNDGYSVSYVAPDLEKDFISDVRRCIKMYLSGTGLTYLGTSPIYDLKGGDGND